LLGAQIAHRPASPGSPTRMCRRALPIFAALLAGCPGERLVASGGEVAVSPARLEFPTTWVGYPTHAALTLRNTARGERRVPVSVEAPFAIAESELVLAGGESRELDVAFAPDAPGHFEAALLTAQVVGDAAL